MVRVPAVLALIDNAAGSPPAAQLRWCKWKHPPCGDAGSTPARSPMRKIEFFGGPLDGSTPLVPEGQDCVVYTDGATVFQYRRDEVVEGPKIRLVFRLLNVVPLPRREVE